MKLLARNAIAAVLPLLLSVAVASTSAKFSLRSVSSHAAYNNTAFGGVGYLNSTLVAGLQPLQTLPVGGTITDEVLSFIGMDPTDDAIPAYFIHGSESSWINLDVWGVPQTGYSLDSHNILKVRDGGSFYGMYLIQAMNFAVYILHA
jgi:hypothetical protein